MSCWAIRILQKYTSVYKNSKLLINFCFSADFDSLKTNSRFMNHLTHIYTEHKIFSNYAKAILKTMITTKSKIEKEITKAQQSTVVKNKQV